MNDNQTVNPKFARIDYIGLGDDEKPGEHKGQITAKLTDLMIFRDDTNGTKYAVKLTGIETLFIIAPEVYLDLQMFLSDEEYIAYEKDDDDE